MDQQSANTKSIRGITITLQNFNFGVHSSDLYYLPIRGFGDFVITVYLLRRMNDYRKPVLLLPEYMRELAGSLQAEDLFSGTKAIPLSRLPLLNDIRSIKSPGHINRFLQELALIRKSLAPLSGNELLLDHRSRRTRVLHSRLAWPQVRDNVYTDKQAFLLETLGGTISANVSEKIVGRKPLQKIVLFPHSRVAAKELSPSALQDLAAVLPQGAEVQTAYFGSGPEGDIQSRTAICTYRNFYELSDIVRTADLIISSDSLPVHLAMAIQVPHVIICNYKANRYWQTPFAEENESLLVFLPGEPGWTNPLVHLLEKW